MWVQILRNKYIQSKTLTQVTVRPNDSPFWKGLMRTKATFFHRTIFIIGNGNSTRFWEDTWLGEMPLATKYRSIYNIVQRKETYVAIILQSNPLNIQFRRSLVGDRWEPWLHLARRLMDAHLSDEPDSIN
uniref:Reverse transcriptase zinc-binding domain-containing protein n=1 Tax=Aegilops tauschii subsp. strangulata TaxID=200361 RepID=A0A453RC95_AEGTS